MCYILYPPEILELKKKIEPYRAHSPEEDRGDLFIEGTPDYIVEYHKQVLDFVKNATTDSKGRPMM